jgi:hypothetical protein
LAATGGYGGAQLGCQRFPLGRDDVAHLAVGRIAAEIDELANHVLNVGS